MKNNKGFTLVEILATIAVLLLIATVTVPAFVSINKNRKVKNDERIAKVIENSAEMYYQMYKDRIDTTNISSGICLPVSYIVEARLLKLSEDEEIDIYKNEYVLISEDFSDTDKIIYEYGGCEEGSIQFK